MRCLVGLTAVFCLSAPLTRAGELPAPLVTGLKNPESVAAGPDGRIYVTCIGEFDKDGDGAVYVVDNGKAVPFATGLDDPRGLVAFQNQFQKGFYVADKQRVWRIDLKGKATVFAAADAFPKPPVLLNDITVDPQSGTVFVSDSGDKENKGGAVYKIGPKGGKATLVTNQEKWPALQRPNGLVLDGQNHLLLLDSGTGTLHRIHLADASTEKVAEGFGHSGGLAWDRHGRLYVSDFKGGKVYVIPRPGMAPVLLAKGFESAADIALDPTNKFILVPDMKAGTITALPAQVPGAEVDETPLPFEASVAFPKLKWTGWQPENEKGVPVQLRPILLTHAGDGSNRVFVATQQGVVHVFPNDQKAEKTDVFLDIRERVIYKDNENEEGFLGLAFHPQFKKNGEFFIFYTLKKSPTKHTNVVSRFRVKKDDPTKGDPDSEEELLRIERKFFNHDGGTLCFGPDGYLYIALGDGGSANDPSNNGQNLKVLHAKVLRIDVDHKDGDKPYAIPKDNPFVGRDDARPEVWAYGLRNVWRMAFDRKTGLLWAGDVGQELYEEIDIIQKGGNYGWKIREGLHPFSAKGVGPRKDLIDPIWEYHHSVGPCIIGGHVYRGKELPELDGYYLYGDYVNGKIWGLRYDEKAKRVVANRPIRSKQGLPILSFGEDEQGEVYFLTTTITGRGIYRFQRLPATPNP
jgi:glucose/arabinose dehydrogenase